MTRKQAIVIVLLLLLAVCEFCAAATVLQDPTSSNFRFFPAPQTAGDMILQDLRGRPVSLSGLRGKVVILNFWRIDCPPCSAEKPILERIYRKHYGRGLEIVAVNFTDQPEQIQSYVQRGGFSFTFAFDPSSRFSLKRETIGPGMQTTFVVNSKSEAIYEIPGVPTTYVIDRTGRVVGNSVGMVNWEDPTVSNLLESLLQPTVRTVSAEINATEAGEMRSLKASLIDGSRKSALSPDNAPARVRLAASEGPLEVPAQYPQQAPHPAATAQQGFTGPVQSPVQLQRPPQTVNPGSQPHPVTRKPPTAAEKKPKPEAATKSSKSAGPAKPVTGAIKRESSVVPSTQPPQVSIPGSQVNPGSAGPQPLPPAMPYIPPRNQVQTGPIVPDDGGTVTARIPGNVGGANLPEAQQVGTPNPIGGFILDSFGPMGPPRQTPRPISVQRPQIEQPTQQPSNIIQQIGQDFQSLGEGIKETFSRMIPGK